MEIIESKIALHERLGFWRAQGECIALVPTMGHLHSGHLSLIEEAKSLADRVVASVFVNPSQFAAGEDFEAYPRTPLEDSEKLRKAGAHLLFLPEVSEIYPTQSSVMTYVEVPGLSEDLCGRFRPGHFRGVATIVCKLLHLVQPDVAIFGEKDYQQLLIIRRMVADLNMPVRIHSVPTVRDPDGLALSSRNAYLLPAERAQAVSLHRCLTAAAESLRQGVKDYASIENEQWSVLESAGFRPDYFAIRRQFDLAVPSADDQYLIVLTAAFLGRTRLIDNIPVVIDAKGIE
jgi:pantoate--beta-alanine ligase